MKKTPLYDEHVRLGSDIVEFAGWQMPMTYTSLVDEHESVRESAGIFDVSHMGEIRIKGEDAEAFVSHIFTNDVENLNDNQINYGFLLYEDGGIVDDLLVYRFSKEHFLLVVNASNVDKDFEWITSKKEGFDVEVVNESDITAEVALQGPKAQEILQTLTDTPLDSIAFFHFLDDVSIAGKKALVSRTGYTGEDGFEIYTSNEDITTVWQEILKAGGERVKPTGLGCRDTLRFEAALPLYGNELSKTITPIEAGFGFFVRKTGGFIGDDRIEKDRAEGAPRKIVGLEILSKGIVRHGYPVLNKEGETIGEITTGYFSPTLKKTIANALIDAKYAKLGEPLYVMMRNKQLEAVQVSKKFLQKKTK
ncbi:glycine cleavage system aminomethyltransferase GcvT [Guggenheimella bovis]